MIRLLLIPLLVLLQACAAPLPTHDWLGPDHAIETIRERGRRIRSLSSECSVILRGDSGSVRLEGAIAVVIGDKFRLRAWKLATPILDVTLLPDSTWVWTSPRAQDQQALADALASLSRDALARAIDTLAGLTLDEGSIDDPGGDHFTVLLDDLAVEIHRDTLTIRRIRAREADAVIELDRYALGPESTVWPRRLRAVSDGSSLEIRLHEPDFNSPIDDAAFRPPARATRRP